jgi:hypothetical protein
MTDPAILTIGEDDNGLFALTVVDQADTGYSAAWQAPGGATAATAVVADYTDGDGFSCQLTSGKLTPSKQTSRRDRAATFCSSASSKVTVGQSTWALDVAFFQDAHVRDGITAFLFEHDTEEAYFLLGARAGTAAPRAVGRVKITAGGFGGEPQADLTDSVSLDVVRKPDVLFGSAGSTRLITGAGVVTDTPA